jgi:hypothetical protein
MIKVQPTAILTAEFGPDSPFVREGDDVYMRHDEIRVSRAGAHSVQAEFYWRGKLTYTMNTGCDLMAGQMLTLTGIEGRMFVRAR